MKRLVAAIALATLCAGCSGGGDADNPIVLRVADTERTRLDFQRYLSAQLVEGDDAEVRSRLFDQFVDEQLMLAEARARGIEIDDADVAVYLAEVEEPTDQDRSLAYAHLALLTLHEVWAADMPPVSEAEVDAYLDREGLTTVRQVELRSLLLPDADEAARIRREIKRRRMTFDEAIALHQDPQMPNTAFRVTWETVDPDLREALEGLKPKQVSVPRELHGNHYLFQFLGWVEDEDEASVEQRRRARKTLESRRARDLLAGRLDELRGRIDHRRFPRRLAFDYRPASAEDGQTGGL